MEPFLIVCLLVLATLNYLESQKVLNWWTDFQLRLNNFHFRNYSEFCKHCEFQSHSKMWRNKTHKRNTKDTKYFRIPLSILQNTSECLHFRIPNTSHDTYLAIWLWTYELVCLCAWREGRTYVCLWTVHTEKSFKSCVLAHHLWTNIEQMRNLLTCVNTPLGEQVGCKNLMILTLLILLQKSLANISTRQFLVGVTCGSEWWLLFRSIFSFPRPNNIVLFSIIHTQVAYFICFYWKLITEHLWI